MPVSGTRSDCASRRPPLALALLGLLVAWPLAAAAQTPPAPPGVYVDTTYVPSTGQTLTVAAGGSLQAALNLAQPGDEIVLQAGATYTGQVTLPNKSGSGWITIRSSALSSLPAAGTRVSPADAASMPKITANLDPVISADSGAHHYRFIGIEVVPTSGTYLYSLFDLGSYATSSAMTPHHIIIDRCYLHGDPTAGTRRGVAMNGANLAVIDSYLADFKELGGDSQAIAGWNGPGPFKIVNNYLEAAAENLLFGGADPSIANLVPSDVEIRLNHMTKPLAWKADDPSYAGTPWQVKNLLELKNISRVLIDGNLFDYNWTAAQDGFAVLFTVRNQDGTAPWSIVSDVTFTNNIVRHSAGGVNILGFDDTYPSQQAQRVLIQNNLFDDISSMPWGWNGILFQILSGPDSVVFNHNTAMPGDLDVILADGTLPATNFVFQNNIVGYGQYGIIGANQAPGTSTLQVFFPGAVVTKNVFAGGSLGLGVDPYPAGNVFLASFAQVGFTDFAGGNYRLLASSPCAGAATDGSDIGMDVTALTAAISGAATPPVP